MANKKIQATELDFDSIKQSLKTYLQGQSEFSDYNFEGSGLSILLDVLALNTHYNSLYLNLALNEAFLDTASKRSSVVSKAKELGYIPRSARSATARVNVTFIDNNISSPDYMEIPAYSLFTATVDGTSYSFYTTQSYIAYKSGNQYLFTDVILKEGKLFNYSYTYTNQGSYVVPNANIDTTTFNVTVQDYSGSSSIETFTNASSIINVGSDSNVYFLKENYDGYYELQFGDGNIGKKLDEGNYININYLISSLDAPNGIKVFNYSNAFVTTIDAAYGGSVAEDIESIRWNAPRYYTTQNRCVTVDDYKSIIKTLYNVVSVNVWGGENNIPPQYGKVFISIVPSSGDYLTDDEKDYIMKEILEPRKALSVTPEFVNPIYLKLELTVNFFYNQLATTKNAGDLTALVNQTILDYNDAALTSFDGVFKQSRLAALIDNTDDSITSNDINIKLHREITPIYNVYNTYDINIGNAIAYATSSTPSVVSTKFYTPDADQVCFISDVPSAHDKGTLNLYYISTTGENILVKTIGTVTYSTGVINITSLNISALYSNLFELLITLQNSDVVSNQNQFVTIPSTYISITPNIDKRGN